MTVLTIDLSDVEAVLALRHVVDPDGHTDPTTFQIGMTHYGRTVVDDEPDFVGARVTDRWDRVWLRISNHEDAIWMCEAVNGSGEDNFYDIQAEYGPLVEAAPDFSWQQDTDPTA